MTIIDLVSGSTEPSPAAASRPPDHDDQEGCSLTEFRLLLVHAFFEILTHLNTALSPSPQTLFLKPLFSLLQFGGTIEQRLLQREAARLNLGMGALSAASGNLNFLSNLFMPWVVVKCYERFKAQKMGSSPLEKFTVLAPRNLFHPFLIAVLMEAFNMLSVIPNCCTQLLI